MSLGQTKRLMEVWWMEGSRRCRIFQLLMGVRKNGGMLGILRKRIGALTNLVTVRNLPLRFLLLVSSLWQM
uniref:Uncharacterized protein n=1 Tax=Brassica campestris TaxID=3711 RepID=A0A3P6CXX2_BRACM|nr:unnamed protein product [Brassica rapa]